MNGSRLKGGWQKYGVFRGLQQLWLMATTYILTAVVNLRPVRTSTLATVKGTDGDLGDIGKVQWKPLTSKLNR